MNIWIQVKPGNPIKSIQIVADKHLQTDKVRAIDAGGLYLQDDGGNGIFIEDGGQVGVNTSSPNYSLDVNGSAKIGSDFYAGSAFKISAGGAVGDIAPASDGDIIKWDDSSNKWVAGANVGGGGGGGVGEVPLATIDSLPSGQSIHQIDFAETYNVEPRIATQLEIDGEGSIIPYVVSGVSTSGYHLIFAQDIPNNNYRIHTTFGGRDVHWETGAGASLYYNDGDVSIQRNFTIGGNLTVNGTQTIVNTETLEIEDHNIVIASNTGYNQLTAEYPSVGDAYAGILWGTGDAGEASPVSLTYQSNKGFAFEGGNVGIGTTSPNLTGLQLGTALVVSSLTGGDIVAHKSGSSVNVGDICGSLLIANSDIDGLEDHFVGMWGKVSSTNGSQNLHLAAGRSGYEGDAPHMTIDSAGNVGIGTTNPDYKLDVKESTNGTYAAKIFNNGGDSYGLLVKTSSGVDEDFPILDLENTAGNVFRVQANGNVGIGTTSPAAKLEIFDSIKPIIKLNGTGSNALNTNFGEIQFYNRDGSGDGPNVAASIHAQSHSSTGAGGSLVFSTEDANSGVEGQSAEPRMTILSNGNVGIGTTSPDARLEVKSGVNALPQSDISADTGTALRILGNDAAAIDFGSTGRTNNGGVGQWIQARHSEVDSTYYSLLLNPLGGNVGIGTTNPGAKLDIEVQEGDLLKSKVLNLLTAKGRITQGTTTLYVNQNLTSVFAAGDTIKIEKGIYTITSLGSGAIELSSGYLGETHTANTADLYNVNDALCIDSAGNVGIGTTDPYYKLEIGDGTDDATYLQLTATNTGNSGFLFGDSDARAQGRVEYNHSNDYMRFRTDGTERMRIDSDGNVGIGTTNPAANHKLHIKNTETANFRLERNKAGHTNAQNGYLQITAAESSNLIYSKDLDGNGKDFVIDGGNVGIGTTNPGSYKLNVNGTAYFNDTITVVGTNYTSDDRVKHNEQPIVGALETLSKITPKKYIKTTEMYDANHDFELDA